MPFTDFRKCDGTQRLELVYPGVSLVGCFGERVRLNPCSCCVCVHPTCATRITDEIGDLNGPIRGSAGITVDILECARDQVEVTSETSIRWRWRRVQGSCRDWKNVALLNSNEYTRLSLTKALHSLPDFLVELILISFSPYTSS